MYTWRDENRSERGIRNSQCHTLHTVLHDVTPVKQVMEVISKHNKAETY